MPICIECCYPVSHLYTSYSKADDRSLGKGVRLTQCPRCKRFADKYVEHDFVVLFIDLVLIKPQVYRHLLFNRLGRSDDKFDRSIIRLGTLILLFDVYLSWARIEKSSSLSASSLSTAPIVVQYLFFLTLNTLATLAHHLTVRLLANLSVPHPYNPTKTTNDATASGGDISPPTPSTPIPPPNSAPSQSQTPMPSAASNNAGQQSQSQPQPQPQPPLSTSTTNLPPPPPLLRRTSTTPLQIEPIPPPSPASPNSISTALLVSSCTKLFPILLVIWSPETSDSNNGANPPSDASSSSSSPSSSSPPGSGTTGMFASSLGSAVMNYISSSQQQLSSSSSSSSSLSSSILDPLLSLVWSITNTHLVLLNNTEALFILLNCGYVRAAMLALSGQLARWVVEKTLLGVVGL
ncbi:hypothetical protein AJ79_10205 [Helicocarpus griseus UAMH5409]|uniref:Protein ARV n=1 Tax=Helicocarpus griseus UAMH5409 TaxID=1447875 RepID=A0A2B7WF26_9EURO|nr:hypothetical protein AJ79_10205 [Helicocarpus griseus UAMH5409]